MPIVKFYPYMGPNRRSDKKVVEIKLLFTADEPREVRVDSIRRSLVEGGVIGEDETYPEHDLPENPVEAYASVLAQTALLLQRKTGHRVDEYSVERLPVQDGCLVLVEHEHCDVGMTAVKLASELVRGRRRMLAEPFLSFSRFAAQRLLPRQTGAIIEVAGERGIPVIHLERNPNKRQDFDHLTGGERICPNGLIMLGHGAAQQVLDGTYSPGLGEDLSGAGGAIETADTDAGHHREVAQGILARLFPDPGAARMPIIAITGTNGKTTTTRMIAHIMQHAGKRPGMVCTDGIYVNGREIAKGDKAADSGHLKVLMSRDADIAVLETHHAGIITRGFCFDWCDVAICLNVTADHLGVNDIHSVEEMAEVKRALVERARYAAVLNADDGHCMSMAEAVTAQRVCLVSMSMGIGDLESRAGGRRGCFCLLEQLDGQEWIVIHDGGERFPVAATGQIPATFDGTARFNVSNAMHAALASYLAGVEPGVIARALGDFTCDYRSTPGRMNIFDDLPFRIVMDFAHNPDGYRKLCEFVDRQQVRGRKLVAFAGTGDRTDEILADMSAALAGHFDFYFCKEHVRKETDEGARLKHLAHVMQKGLIDAGVDPAATRRLVHGKEDIFRIFKACEPGDLLVLLVSYVEMHQLQAYISEYAATLEQPA